MAEELENPATEIPGGGDATPAETRRDDIASAFETVEARDAPPAEAPAPPAGAQPAPGERARGPDGKFVPAPAGAPPAASSKPGVIPAGKQPLAAPQGAPKAAPDPGAAATPQPQLRAPASWKPQAREHWAKLPAEVQQEVMRRESEVTRTMNESAKAREALTHVQGALAPFAANIQASGSDAITAISNLFRADNTLRHGSITEKAQIAADIIKSYGVDIATLDSVLAGQPAQADPNAMLADRLRQEMRQEMRQQLQPVLEMQGRRQEAVRQINQEAAGEVQGFAQDASHEFFEDVRADMADIIDLYTQRGASISLQDAYDRAIKLHPQISEIVAKRAETERASAAQAAAQRARRAAASIGGSPAPAGVAPGLAGDSRRAAIEAAWEESSGG